MTKHNIIDKTGMRMDDMEYNLGFSTRTVLLGWVSRATSVLTFGIIILGPKDTTSGPGK